MGALLTGPRRWWLLGALVSLLLVVATTLLVISPQRSAMSSALERAAQAEQQIVAASAQAKKLAQQSAELDTVKKELEALQGRIPDRDQVAALLVKASDLAKSTKVVLTGFDPGTVTALESSAPDRGTARLGYISIGITGVGTFDEIRAYLSALEGLDRAFIVNALSVTRSGDSSSSGRGDATKGGDLDDLTLSVTARVFVRGDIVPDQTSKTPAKPASGDPKAGGA